MGFVRASTFGLPLAALFVSRVALAEVCTRYPEAARYPLLPTRDLADTTTGITSGSTAIVYRLAAATRVSVRLESAGVHAASLLPLERGRAVLAKSTLLPATADGEALIVLTSLTTSKADAPYTLHVEPVPEESPEPSPAASNGSGSPAVGVGGGCSSSRAPADRASATALAPFAAAWVLIRRRSPSRRKRHEGGPR